MAVTISRFVINPSWSSAKKVPASWEDISLSFGKNAFADEFRIFFRGKFDW